MPHLFSVEFDDNGLLVSAVVDEENGTWTEEQIQTRHEKQVARHRVVGARKKAYGDIGDQLDMQYKDLINGTTTWKDHIAKVKADNPLPDVYDPYLDPDDPLYAG